MVRAGTLAGVLSLCTWIVGCAPGGDTQFELRKAEQERDALKQRLSDEQARNAAWQARFDTEERQWSADRATVATLTTRVEQLSKTNEELGARFKDMEKRPVTRPAVPATPLPAEVDDALNALAAKYTDRVWYERGRGAVSFANDRMFDPGSDVVRSEAQPALNELAAILARTPANEYEIIVVGHTDETAITKPETLAKHPSNWHLAAHRAIGVKDVLVKAGLPPARFGVMAYAEFRPVGSEPARNRRVEIFVVRKGEVQPLAPVQRPKR
jgi:chemotaxis protein MotB